MVAIPSTYIGTIPAILLKIAHILLTSQSAATRAIVIRLGKLEGLPSVLRLFISKETQMRKQYLHLSAYPCDTCAGPVVAGSLAVRENEISKETDIRQVGAICLSCGHRQSEATEPAHVRHLPPMQWEPAGAIKARQLTAAFVEAVNRAELH